MRLKVFPLLILSFLKALLPIKAISPSGLLSVSHDFVIRMKSYLRAHANRRGACALFSIEKAFNSNYKSGSVVLAPECG